MCVGLKEQGIHTQIHYIPVHLQPYYRERFGFKVGDFPNAEAYFEKALTIPLYPGMTDQDVDLVAEALQELITGG